MAVKQKRDGQRGGAAGTPLLKAQKIERDALIWSLRCKGWTMQRIADEIGRSSATVCLTLKRLSNSKSVRLQRSIDKVRAEQIGQLEYAIEQAFEGWEQSKQPIKRQVKRVGGARGDSEEISGTTQSGDPRYLETALKAMSELRRFLGIDAPVVTANIGVNTSAQVEAITAEAFKDALDVLAEAGITLPAFK